MCVKGSGSRMHLTTKPFDGGCPEPEYEKSPHKRGFEIVCSQTEVKPFVWAILFAKRIDFFYYRFHVIMEKYDE
ncbi:Hypothetical protein AKI40_2795 [Enterobacter sp. FY-07]|nr:Hypothetical protein AKI40_2795 [Enterobacter sp. FY-07]